MINLKCTINKTADRRESVPKLSAVFSAFFLHTIIFKSGIINSIPLSTFHIPHCFVVLGAAVTEESPAESEGSVAFKVSL